VIGLRDSEIANTITRGKFSLILLPNELAEKLNLEGLTLLGLLFLSQLYGFLRPARTISYTDHLFGMLVGTGSALWWKNSQQSKRDTQRKGFWNRGLGR
jgi:hypothetical protein